MSSTKTQLIIFGKTLKGKPTIKLGTTIFSVKKDIKYWYNVGLET